MSRWVCCDNCLHKNICGDRMEMLRKDCGFNGNGCMQYCTDTIFDDKRKLEAKLAEKEKQYNNFCIYEAKFRKTLGNWQNQVAIEQLEKVKEYADIDFRKNCYINAVELDKFIDNQIEELKKGDKVG